MKTPIVRGLLFAGGLAALCFVPARAQTIEFKATINAAQETTGSTSTATGTAVLLYHVDTNTFDLDVVLQNFPHTLSNSHIHEGAPGVAGPVVTGLGGESVYTRDGDTLRGTFTNVAHLGTPLTLLQNGAYINFHTADWPGGEVRGQLIAQPKRLVAILSGGSDGANTGSAAYGAAYISFDSGQNLITTRVNIYNFTNTLANSHYHEGALSVAGPVVQPLGGASVYTKTGTSYGALFSNQTYGGNALTLLTGGAYINVHSNVFPGGEIRGQVYASDELDVPRIVNVSTRGWVGAGDQVMIAGFVVTGKEPVRVLLTARGPSLTAQGVSGVLANPQLSLHDSTGREIVSNDDFATGFGAADLPGTGFAPTDPSEAALLLVLPPGLYTSIVSGAGGTTGVALTEVYEVRATSANAQ
ncbi:MAG TPA: CHRD domain-containing protein [Opitutus sp.]|nr:CHRD domain-containing protein [Opitutus sp.]